MSLKIIGASQKSLKNASFSFGGPLILRHTSSHNECITFHSTYQTMAGILNPHQVTTQRTIPSVCKKMAGKHEDCSNTISAGRHLQKPPASAGRRATGRRNIEVSIGRSKGAAVFTARKSDKKKRVVRPSVGKQKLARGPKNQLSNVFCSEPGLNQNCHGFFCGPRKSHEEFLPGVSRPQFTRLIICTDKNQKRNDSWHSAAKDWPDNGWNTYFLKFGNLCWGCLSHFGPWSKSLNGLFFLLNIESPKSLLRLAIGWVRCRY